MHIPPYYKRRGVQYFFVGVITGAIIAYIIFLYINGELTERWIEQNVELQGDINDLQDKIDALSKDKEDLNKENKEKLTVQEITVEIENAEELKLDRFITHELTLKIKEQVSQLIGKSIQGLTENRSLIYSTIENKTFPLDEFSYQAKITELIISTKMHIAVKVSMSN